MMLLVNYLIFPGFLFSFFAGGLGWWVERKLTARFQFRVGPPWYQNYVDILKLFVKEIIVPKDAHKALFIFSPIISFSACLFVSFLIGQAAFYKFGFFADSLVILYLLIIPSLFIIVGGLSSSNPLATCGASREIKLMLSYEFVFIVSLATIIIKSGGALSLEAIVDYQAQMGPHISSISGVIACILAIFWLQAKLGIVPFDIAEAEQEIMAGPFIEYGGPLLGFFRLSKLIFYFSLPLFLILLLWGDNLGWHIIYKYLIIVLIISVIKNVNPRLRINDILRFFWFFLFPLGVLGLGLAIMGF